MNSELIGQAHSEQYVVAGLDAAKRRGAVDVADGHSGLSHRLADEPGLDGADLVPTSSTFFFVVTDDAAK